MESRIDRAEEERAHTGPKGGVVDPPGNSCGGVGFSPALRTSLMRVVTVWSTALSFGDFGTCLIAVVCYFLSWMYLL